MLLHMDGFDSYAVIADLSMEYTVANCVLELTGGRYGAGALRITSGGGIARSLPAVPTDVWVGAALKPAGGGANLSDQTVFSFIGDTGRVCYITYSNDTSLWRVWNYSGAVAFAPQLFVSEAWHWVECRVKLGTTDGIVELWVDNVRILNLTNINTNTNGSAAITNVALGFIGTPGVITGFTGHFDDWYILNTAGSRNNSRLGDSRIETRIPISDATPNNGTPSSGTDHFAMVNEAQWESTNNITMNNVNGQEERFNMSPLTSNPATIFATRQLIVMEKTDGGTMEGSTVVSSAGALSVGPSTPGLNVFCHIDGITELDPNTSAAWTKAAVDASKVGFKITT